MSLVLRCTVRGCGRPLVREAAALRCERGHAFDRGREGYWSLLQPQDRRSSAAGDRDAAIDARARWLARGFADGLLAALGETIDALALPRGAAAVDVGCGEGTITSRVLGGRGLDVCGIDLAVRGVRLAARLAPGITWIVANADRGLPFADRSLALVLSVFGRRPTAEMARVISAGGAAVVVLPGASDLVELRAAAQGSALERDRVEDALAALSGSFVLESRREWKATARHDRVALEDALAMSYRGVRSAERARLATVDSLEVTAAAEILFLRPRFA